jgi:phosphoserine phosphatase
MLGEEIYDEILADKIWPGTRALAMAHLDAGQQVWLVTATPFELADVIARRLGLTGAMGTVAESVDGVFTGRLLGDILHGSGKAHAVRALAIRQGLNLKRCTAYSDSINDVPMLSLVGTAVAVNPDSELRDVARERGWEIKDFRTARKAAKIGVPSALAIGAVGGAVAAAVSRCGGLGTYGATRRTPQEIVELTYCATSYYANGLFVKGLGIECPRSIERQIPGLRAALLFVKLSQRIKNPLLVSLDALLKRPLQETISRIGNIGFNKKLIDLFRAGPLS